MDVILETQSFPVAIADGFITNGETTIVMQCHDRMFQKVVVLDKAGEKLFTGESKGIASYSWRRTVKDASGNPVFDLRKVPHCSIKNKWAVFSPSGREVCAVQRISFSQRLALDLVVRNEEDKGKEVVVEVRPRDRSALTTLVYIEGAPVAEIQMTGVNLGSFDLDRSVWKARVAAGVDLALIAAIMLCRAEVQHMWRE